MKPLHWLALVCFHGLRPWVRAFLGIVCGMVLLGGSPGEAREVWSRSAVQGTPESPPPFVAERILPGVSWEKPLDLAVLPGTRKLVVLEQSGRLTLVDPESADSKTSVFGVLSEFDPEMREGFAFTFHPDFRRNRWVFVWGNLDLKGQKNREEGSRIVRFRVSEGEDARLEPASGQVIFSWLEGGHNGGNLRFGPDGMLYVSTGDASPPDPPDPLGTGQDIGDLLSSVLRLDVDHPAPGRGYGIPADNPFVGMSGARPEVWCYGLRNPWRMAFHPRTGELFVGDVGWEQWEMIYRVERGGNYGWSLTEGSRQEVRPGGRRGPGPVLAPLVAHSHEEAASITGGEFYFGKKFSELEGGYLYGDWQTGTIWWLRHEGNRVLDHRVVARTPLMPAGFGLDADGEFLISDYAGGGLWRLARNPRAGGPATFPTRLSETGLFEPGSLSRPAPGVFPYGVAAARWADHAVAERWIGVPTQESVVVAETSQGVTLKGRWKFPKDTVLAKTYELEMERGNAASRRPVETQLLHFDGSLWGAYTYRWREDRGDAELVGADGDEVTFMVRDASAPGGERRQRWRFFSRSECGRCHSMWTGFAPGFQPAQLATEAEVGRERSLERLKELALIPAATRVRGRTASDWNLEERVRGYLHANCSSCHRFNGGGNVPLYLNAEVALRETGLIEGRAVQGDLGLPEGRIVAAGDPARSVLLYRLATSGRGHMPYLGGQLVENAALLVVRDWIASLPQEVGSVSDATRDQRLAESVAMDRLRAGELGVLTRLLESASGALSVALAVVDQSLPESVREQAIEAGASMADPLKRGLFERFLPESRQRRVLGAGFDAAAVLGLSGDAVRGKKLFGAVCGACHQLEGEGRPVGPDLSKIAAKWDRVALLDQIREPAKVVDPEWRLSNVVLRSGETKMGFVKAEQSRVELRMVDGLREELSRAEVSEIQALPGSMMPAGLLDALTAGEAADVLAYLLRFR